MGYTAAGLALIVGGGMLTGKGPAGSLKASPVAAKPPPVMADQNQVLQEEQLQESKDAAARYGRAATILTGTGQANTTGDKLGP